MKPAYFIFAFWFLFPLLALAKERYSVKQTILANDSVTGRAITVPASRGYTYEIVETKDDGAQVKFYDREGFQLVGTFNVSKELVQDALKSDITAGLKATATGAINKKPCCDVSSAEPSPTSREKTQAKVEKVAGVEAQPNRSPAIAPGTTIVYAPMPPRRQPEKVARTRPAPRLAVQPRAPASTDPLCRALDSFKAKGVPDAPLRQALFFLSKARKDGRVAANSRYLSIADYSQNSSSKRFYLLDLQQHSVTREKVSHGGGHRQSGYPGDPNHDGRMNSCSRASGDAMTRAGFFRVGDFYFSNKGRYKWPMLTRNPPRNGMQLMGLSPGVNEDAVRDGVVMHEAKYNSAGAGIMGRSYGCPAFAPGRGAPLMQKLRGGSLFYSYTPVCRNDMVKVLSQVQGWQQFCR